MSNATIQGLLGDFKRDAEEKVSLKDGRPVTVWLPAGVKERYDLLQTISGREFGRKIRKAVVAMIEAAEAKTDSKAA